MALPKRAPLYLALLIGAFLAGCGLGRDSDGDGRGLSDPIVAATVNGRPIYVEDVRAHAVARGLLEEGADLDANSDAFFFALEELIQFRLFAMEAEARGLDRNPHVRRQLENARERVLAAAIYEEIDERAVDPAAIERLYRENTARLGGGESVRLRQIVFQSREEAEAALRRIAQGERFEALAFELSTERNTAPDGGDMRFRPVSDLVPQVRQAVERASLGQTFGPIEIGDSWYVFRLDDRREGAVPSLETLRPRIIDWLRFQEISTLHERLERDARIERVREQQGVEPGGEVTAPEDAQPLRPTPDAGVQPGAPPPPFPFAVGPGGVSERPAPAAPAPAPAPARQPAQQPAQQPPPASPAESPQP